MNSQESDVYFTLDVTQKTSKLFSSPVCSGINGCKKLVINVWKDIFTPFLFWVNWTFWHFFTIRSVHFWLNIMSYCFICWIAKFFYLNFGIKNLLWMKRKNITIYVHIVAKYYLTCKCFNLEFLEDFWICLVNSNY